MPTRVDPIADGIFRISTCVAEVAPPAGFTFNQFLIVADEPLLFHCGQRFLFPSVSAAVATVVPIEQLRWISFGHIEADECGAMNMWLQAAPDAEVVYSELGCQISVGDLADRAPRALPESEVLDLGGKRIRLMPTPHVPHGWEAQVMFEETTATLFCGDLFTHVGDPAPMTTYSLVAAAADAEDTFQATSVGALTAPTIRRLAELRPARLALMHGASFEGDASTELERLAQFYEQRLGAAPK